jgi:hypothetical protein
LRRLGAATSTRSGWWPCSSTCPVPGHRQAGMQGTPRARARAASVATAAAPAASSGRAPRLDGRMAPAVFRRSLRAGRSDSRVDSNGQPRRGCCLAPRTTRGDSTPDPSVVRSTSLRDGWKPRARGLHLGRAWGRLVLRAKQRLPRRVSIVRVKLDAWARSRFRS